MNGWKAAGKGFSTIENGTERLPGKEGEGMWKTVMIDDEPWALEGLAEIIDWQAAGFSIQGRFTDPQEAFAFLCESWPVPLRSRPGRPGRGLPLQRTRAAV